MGRSRAAGVFGVGVLEAGLGVGLTVGDMHLMEKGEVDGGKIDIGIEILIDPGEIEVADHGKEGTIDGGTAYDEGLILVLYHLEHLRNAVGYLEGAGGCGGDFEMEVWVVGEDDIAAFGQRFLRERVKGAAAHDDGVAAGEAFEPLEVVAEVPQEVVVLADGHVLGTSHDDGEVGGWIGVYHVFSYWEVVIFL